ncbi:type IV pilin protein [Tautonia plasticadhaerens]|uniref:Type II secretion system protein G n=1 Tax=Tautonia plasticadhaerens TaxID=2527974 RepID=A0A518HFS3_9BACT|nr:prepilin-type N-terminal cleavage/methylation domain-containing protein [Tautonia plasticadhaerens]QDV39678.1 Type II secretion system protein G precursor [Tautonia plasticadhaerens]
MQQQQQTRRSVSKPRRGFTLVELAVVVVIIGVLAAFGVPRFLQSVERSKAAEAFSYLSAVRTAQERYHAREGTYASDQGDLDIQAPTPKYFSIGTIGPGGTSDLEDSWTLTLTRSGSSAGYGAYEVTFTDQGYDAVNSTIDAEINPIGGSTT